MSKRRYKNTILFCLVGIVIIFTQQACSGGQCAANSSVLTDIDADCVDDSVDNCRSVSDPTATYNPEQFDGDDDGIGVPCDIDDTDSENALSMVTNASGTRFNVAGVYEVLKSTCQFRSSFVVEQNQGRVLLSTDADGRFYGDAFSENGESILVKLEDFENVESVCDMVVDVFSSALSLHCTQNQVVCDVFAVKSRTLLWDSSLVIESEEVL